VRTYMLNQGWRDWGGTVQARPGDGEAPFSGCWSERRPTWGYGVVAAVVQISALTKPSSRQYTKALYHRKHRGLSENAARAAVRSRRARPLLCLGDARIYSQRDESRCTQLHEIWTPPRPNRLPPAMEYPNSPTSGGGPRFKSAMGGGDTYVFL
jgi:hypothetical protein